MNKIVVTTLMVFAIISLMAQEQKSFQKGSVVLNTGINLGGIDNRFYDPGFLASVDFGVHDYVSAGPYTGASFFGPQDNRVVVGGRTSFHWWQLTDDRVAKDLKQNQIDFYLTFFLGLDLRSDFDNGNPPSRRRRSDLDAGLNLGFRWYPKANNVFAVFTEFGYTPISYGVIGASFKPRK